MLSARSLFQEIFDNDEAFRLFCSVAAGGEAQGGWENARIAALVPAEERAMAPRIARHGADEDKHGRIFEALMRKRGLEPVEVPPDTDYTMLLERNGIGLPHDKLRREEPLTVRDLVTYLAHSRVTEQRASEQMRLLCRYFGGHPEIGRAVRMISADEDNHLAYCHEELLRLAAAGYGPLIRRTLRETGSGGRPPARRGGVVPPARHGRTRAARPCRRRSAPCGPSPFHGTAQRCLPPRGRGKHRERGRRKRAGSVTWCPGGADRFVAGTTVRLGS
ncbi:ferritin-like domain-containing protein [Streptomyces chilikensis]|uniref:ferritin-like domain-containing protein n=1 Tax=Streptomyces chilikensis TaxID=1194079 RepID=UPI001F0E2684|nr:ferritin-like domain-containing protein [Streptomyces chilikensis]